MALNEDNMVMPVAPMNGGYGNGGFGGLGGDWAWILLLLLIGGNGWGFGGGWGGMMGAGMMGADFGLYPWLNNSQHISDGFRDQQLQTSLSGLQNSVTAGFGNVQNSLCSGFAGVNSAITGAQMANMQSLFGVQSAIQGGFADSRAGVADVKYTVATEACADRAVLSEGIRDVLAATKAQTQAILDKLCQDKLDAKNDTIAQLRSELMYARGQASQDVQTAAIRAGQATTANQLVSELRSCPIPTMPVYGNTPIFTCAQNVAGGCGCNNGFGFNG